MRIMSRSEIRISSSTVITARVRTRYVGINRFDNVSGTRGCKKCAVVPYSGLQIAIVGGRYSCKFPNASDNCNVKFKRIKKSPYSIVPDNNYPLDRLVGAVCTCIGNERCKSASCMGQGTSSPNGTVWAVLPRFCIEERHHHSYAKVRFD